MNAFRKTVTHIRLVSMRWLGRVFPWLTAQTWYQAQDFEDDGEWASWRSIGWQTKSRVVIRRILAEHAEAHPADKVRVLRVKIWERETPLGPFLPNSAGQTAGGQSQPTA